MSDKQYNIDKIETWGDLNNLIEKVIDKLCPDMTGEEILNKFEKFHQKMEKISNETNEDPESHPGAVFLFGAALNYIYNVAIKMKYHYIGRFLLQYNMDNLPIKDDKEELFRFIKTITVLLNMCIKNGEIIDIDQCIFVEDDNIDDDIKVEMIKAKNQIN